MDTKWKSRLAIAGWLLIFTFGLSGLLEGISQGDRYLKGDYFQTDQFDYELDHFIDYLSMFELNKITEEEAKQAITVSKEEIEEHRYRYGDLSAQVSSIKLQYEHKIQDALSANNQEVANIIIAERDAKIADITENFKSDEHVRAKVIKEKEAQIDQYFTELESYRAEFLRYKTSFKYYLKEVDTGKVYTNLAGIKGTESLDTGSNLRLSPESEGIIGAKTKAESNTGEITTTIERELETAVQTTTIIKDHINDRNMSFIENFINPNYLSTEGRDRIVYSDIMFPILDQASGTFEGAIGIPKTAPMGNTVLQDYYDFQQNQITFFIHAISGIIALIVSLILYKKTAIIRSVSFEKWKLYYKRVPIDISIVAFLFSCLVAMLILTNTHFMYYDFYFYNSIDDIVIYLIGSIIFVTLSLIQGKFLIEILLDGANLKDHLQNTLIVRTYYALQSAFLNRRVGTQIFILLAAVFSCGFGVVLVAVKLVFLVIYVPLLLLVGVPIFILIMKRTGYFNQIIHNTSELANGNFEPDLPVKGKSVLAKLAENINTLKHGVKVSQKAQAKSERLKTELITNVSHDLRTPLTSIITYTELLKTPDLASEERDSYLEIIDRKSKRLKVLIDDLFEASKMASGNMELNKEKVDLVQLLQQALAEHNETISQSGLQFRVTKPETPLYAVVDGQKLWRVFDNLIGNILKYSLENTRVYISMNQSSTKSIVIEFKNVTKYELGGNIDEMFERFKRGDTSRHTEGSGLGLAIAKSIIDLHDGTLDIAVDGDLFKVTITLGLN